MPVLHVQREKWGQKVSIVLPLQGSTFGISSGKSAGGGIGRCRIGSEEGYVVDGSPLTLGGG